MSHARGVCLFALALPLCLGLALIAPPAVSPAQGCTGGSAEALSGLPDGWHWVSLDSSAGTSPPADAVVVLRGTLRGLDEAAALALASVTVKDEGGVAVPGTLGLVDRLSVEVGLADIRAAALVWRPAAPLAPGKKHQISWQVGGQSASAELVVVPTSEAPAPPNAEAPQRAEVMAMSGPYVHCNAPGNCTGTVQLTFHRDTARRPGVVVAATPGAAVANASYQVFELRPVPGKGTPAGLPQRGLAVTAAGAAANKLSLSMAFSDDLPEYCVKLASTDLSTGLSTESSELCVAATAPLVDTAAWWESSIGSCTEPPHPELTDIWCKQHGSATECGGPGEGGTSGGGGSAGSAGSSAQSDSSGCACSSQATPSLGAPWLVAFGLLGLGARRRAGRASSCVRVGLRARTR